MPEHTFKVGDHVRSVGRRVDIGFKTASRPPTTGTVVAISGLFLLVQFDNWANGYGGPGSTASGHDKWFVLPADLELVPQLTFNFGAP